jgi:hypothetical protein
MAEHQGSVLLGKGTERLSCTLPMNFEKTGERVQDAYMGIVV